MSDDAANTSATAPARSARGRGPLVVLGRVLWRTVVVLVVGVALTLGAARVLLPELDVYRPQIEKWLSARLGQPVTVDALHADWRGWSPVLRADGVSILPNRSARAPVARLESITLELDPIASFRTGEPRPSAIEMSGAALAVIRKADGAFTLRGLGTPDATSTADYGALVRQLLAQGSVGLTDAEVIWYDERERHPPQRFHQVSARIRGSFGHYEIELHAQISPSTADPGVERPSAAPGDDSPSVDLGSSPTGGEIRALIQLEGDLLTPAWSGDAYLQGSGLELHGAREALAPLGVSTASAALDLKVWTHWRFARLVRLTGDVALGEIAVVRDGTRLPIRGARGQVAVDRDSDGWRARITDFVVETPGSALPPTSIEIEADGDIPDRILGRVSDIELSKLGPVLAGKLPGRAGDWLRDARPRGRLNGIEFLLARATAPGPGGAEPAGVVGTSALRMRLDDVEADAASGVPAMRDVAGTIELEPHSGAFELETGSLGGFLETELPAPVAVDELSGRATWVRDGSGVRLEVERLRATGVGLEAEGSATIRWLGDGSAPSGGVVVNLAGANVGRIAEFLPRRLPDRFESWVRRALRAGEIEKVEFLVHGPLSTHPFVDAGPRVQARARVRNAVLDYATGWPELTDLEGVLWLEGKQAGFRIEHAKITGVPFENATVRIPDVSAKPASVEIRGTIAGDTAQAASFIQGSPLGPKFKHFLDSVTAVGPTEIDLEIDLDLGPERRKRVAGKMAVTGNVVNLPGFAEGMQKVNGTFHFEGSRIHAQAVDARYLGHPIVVSTGDTDDGEGTRIRIEGRATRAYLAGHLFNVGLIPTPDADDSPVLERLDGDTSWSATVDVPRRRREGEPLAVLKVSSSLEGVSFDLPAPLAKPAPGTRPMVVESRFYPDGVRMMRVDYGSQATALFHMVPGDDGYELDRGVLQFGDHEVALPREPGLVVRGLVDRLSSAAWQRLLSDARVSGHGAPGERAGDAGTGQAAVLSKLRSVGLSVHSLDLLGGEYRNVRVDASRAENGSWVAVLRGEGVEGEVVVPPDFATRGVTARFDRLVMRLGEAGTGDLVGALPDPRALPPLRFQCKRCQVGERELGTIKLVANPTADGLRFDNIYLLSPAYEVRATGAWLRLQEGDTSSFELELHTDDLGRFLGTFGKAGDATTGGATDMVLNALWPGSPADFDLRNISGVLHFRSSTGRLLNVKRGATGRLFGLLVLTSLPRRLLLDFSDLFDEGFVYDRMEGSFSIDGGNAYTNNLRMDSQIATIEVAGRTGLVKEDYDQTIVLTPKLTSSIPLAPLWLAEKVLNRSALNRSFQRRYTITGTWDAPNVRRVKVEVEYERERPEDRG